MLLAVLCYGIASQESRTHGLIAAAVALLLVTICTAIIAVYFASISVIRKAVSETKLGRTIFNNLFEHTLGISGEDTGEQYTPSGLPTRLSRDEVAEKLHKASSKLLTDERPSTRWTSVLFWLAKTIQKISIWATVKVIVKSCSHDGESVNMFELRDRLASTIDDKVVSYLKQYFTRLALSVIAVMSLISMLIALGIARIPI